MSVTACSLVHHDSSSMLRRVCSKAQKAVDDAVSPMVKEMMETISALQETEEISTNVNLTIKSPDDRCSKAPDKFFPRKSLE